MNCTQYPRLGPRRKLIWQVAGLVLAFSLAAAPHAQRLSEIATFQGVRSNPLVGFGLVVGLGNTGDQTTQTPFTSQAVENMLAQLGVAVPTGSNMQLENVAAVMVTAELPPFAAPGQQIDIVVSSLGTAESLRGGTLLLTPLKGVDGEIYAIAQGNVLIPGISAGQGGTSVQVNQTAAGRIPNGAIIEKTVPSRIVHNGFVRLQLKHASYRTATRVMDAVNQAFGRQIATAVNARTLKLRVPGGGAHSVPFMARVQNVTVSSGRPDPRVIINSRTGSVVMNGTVTLDEAAVSHGNLSVVIQSRPIVSQPNPLSGGQTVVVPNADITVNEGQGTIHYVPKSTSLRSVIRALNRLGATATDLMAILQALKNAGALNAELIIT